MSTIAENIAKVGERIREAAQASGRDLDSIGLLAVSKTKPSAAVREAFAAGLRDFGENYLQEAVEKMAALRQMGAPTLQWHCIGPVQSNKTRLVAEHFDWMHTVDRLKVAQRLSDQRPAHLPPLQVCIQINVDGGANKSGVTPQEALALAQSVAVLPQLCLRGLMSIPEPATGFDAQYALHLRAREVFDIIRASGLPGLAGFDTLSMGMTDDLDAAIAAGSTMVRVGTGIFGSRSRPV